MSLLTAFLVASSFYLAPVSVDTFHIQMEKTRYCDKAYEICLTDICTNPDPEEKKKCMDRCYKDLKDCEKR